MQQIPPDFMAEGLRLAETVSLFGKKLTDMTWEELLASAAHGWKAYTDEINKPERIFISAEEIIEKSKNITTR